MQDEPILNNDEQDKVYTSTSIAISNNNSIDSTILAFEKLKNVAEYLSTSEVFTKGFEIKDDKGNVVIDEITKRPKINTADIALCLLAGNELGIGITGSLMLGKKLNRNTYMSIMRGREMGIGASTSMEKIYTISTSRGDISYTGVDVISAKLIQHGITFLPFIKSFAPYYIYRNPITKEELDYDKILDEKDELLPIYEVIDLTAKTAGDSITKAQAEGKIIITKTRHGEYSKAIFTRKMKDGSIIKHVQRFSTIDAERAELLPTYDDKGVQLTKGKGNWINSTPQMMNNRVISIGGRIIGADLINGIYTQEEVSEIQDVKIID